MYSDVYLILNPGSNGGKSRAYFARIHAALAAHGIACRHAITESLDDAERLSRQANLAACPTVVAVGGDGTLNRVINGFYAPDGARLSERTRLGVIYTGTSPDFCLSHHLPVRDPDKAVATLAHGDSRPIAIGRIQYADGRLRHFSCCANIGLGAQLARAANSGIRARIGDKAGTFLALLSILRRWRPSGLTLNGREYAHVYNLSIGKTRHVASGLKIAHALTPDDRRFYVLCVQKRIWRHLIKLYTGTPLPLEYAERLEIAGDTEVEYDGDADGKLPITITPAPPIELISTGRWRAASSFG
jgi:diacylglycerol kinase family enzyme